MPAPRPVYSVSSDQIGLVAATTKTIFELRTPTTTGIVPVQWYVEFDGVTATAVPVKVDVGIYSSSTGATTTATTPMAFNYGNRGLASACTCYVNANAETNTPTIVETHRVSPMGGLLIQEPLGMELTVGASSFFRIRCTAAAAVNVTFGVRWTE